MSVILASDLVTRASLALFDTGQVRWSQAELLTYLNEGQRVIAVAQPTTTQDVVKYPLVPGARQAIPVDGWLLIDILRNLGPAPSFAPGPAIRVISRRLLDTFAPNWTALKPVRVVQSFIYDLRDQYQFFVYPPNDGTGIVELNYSAIPAPIGLTQTISVTDALDAALFNYMLYRSCAKLFEGSPGPQMATAYLTVFNDLLGIKSGSEAQANANAALLPATANKLAGET